MQILILLVFIGLILVAGAVLLFLYAVRNGDFEHTEELSLLPLEEDYVAESKSER